MSTLSSPRPSIASARTPSPQSSRRPSVESTRGQNIGSSARTPSASPSLAQRRNRAALRDYYKLRPPAQGQSQGRTLSIPTTSAGESIPVSPASPLIPNTELDSPDFDAESYVSHLLATSSLATVLRAENSLINDIRTLDGERKALVYDNYSKLIKAVETIGKMRANIEEQGAPMVMAKTLAPAVAFVAETATALMREQEAASEAVHGRGQKDDTASKTGNVEKETVKWALDTPRRLRGYLSEGKRSEAEQDWAEIKALLAKWDGVKGVNELRTICEDIMAEEG